MSSSELVPISPGLLEEDPASDVELAEEIPEEPILEPLVKGSKRSLPEWMTKSSSSSTPAGASSSSATVATNSKAKKKKKTKSAPKKRQLPASPSSALGGTSGPGGNSGPLPATRSASDYQELFGLITRAAKHGDTNTTNTRGKVTLVCETNPNDPSKIQVTYWEKRKKGDGTVIEVPADCMTTALKDRATFVSEDAKAFVESSQRSTPSLGIFCTAEVVYEPDVRSFELYEEHSAFLQATKGDSAATADPAAKAVSLVCDVSCLGMNSKQKAKYFFFDDNQSWVSMGDSMSASIEKYVQQNLGTLKKAMKNPFDASVHVEVIKPYFNGDYRWCFPRVDKDWFAIRQKNMSSSRRRYVVRRVETQVTTVEPPHKKSSWQEKSAFILEGVQTKPGTVAWTPEEEKKFLQSEPIDSRARFVPGSGRHITMAKATEFRSRLCDRDEKSRVIFTARHYTLSKKSANSIIDNGLAQVDSRTQHGPGAYTIWGKDINGYCVDLCCLNGEFPTGTVMCMFILTCCVDADAVNDITNRPSSSVYATPMRAMMGRGLKKAPQVNKVLHSSPQTTFAIWQGDNINNCQVVGYYKLEAK